MSFRAASTGGRRKPATAAAKQRTPSPERKSPSPKKSPSPQRRSPSPTRGGSPLAADAARNWIINPETGHAIKLYSESKGRLAGPAPTHLKLLRENPDYLRGAQRYASQEDVNAAPEAQRIRAAKGGSGSRPTGWYFNRASHRTNRRVIGNTQTGISKAGVESPFVGPFDTEEAAKAKARAEGWLKSGNKTGRTVAQDPNALYVQFGKSKTGGPKWYKVDTLNYLTLEKAGTKFNGKTIDQLPKYSAAEKKDQAKSSARQPQSPGTKERKRAAAAPEKAAKLAAVRAEQKGRTYKLKVRSPDSNRAVGVEDQAGQTTGGARKIAREQALLKGVAPPTSDSAVIAYIRKLIASGDLQSA